MRRAVGFSCEEMESAGKKKKCKQTEGGVTVGKQVYISCLWIPFITLDLQLMHLFHSCFIFVVVVQI